MDDKEMPTRAIGWCLPQQYKDCNNNMSGRCAILTNSVRYGETCKFYRSVKDTSEYDLEHYHSWKLRKSGLIVNTKDDEGD